MEWGRGNRDMATEVYKLIVQKPDGSHVDLASAILNEGSGWAVIDEPHAEIHRGMTYAGGKIFQDLGVGAKFYMVGQNNNPDGMDMHLTAAFSASEAAIVRTIGVTGRTGGAEVLSVNRRTGAVDSGVQAWWDTTPDDSAPVIVKETYLPGGSGPLALGGQAALRGERIVGVGNWIGLEIENVGLVVMDYLAIEWDFYLADPNAS
jgi:hypothetical protein